MSEDRSLQEAIASSAKGLVREVAERLDIAGVTEAPLTAHDTRPPHSGIEFPSAFSTNDSIVWMISSRSVIWSPFQVYCVPTARASW